jgi:hypothetical protein
MSVESSAKVWRRVQFRSIRMIARNWNSWDPGLLAWARYTCGGAKASLLVECIVTNNGDSLARRLEREMFPFEVGSAPIDIQSKSHAPWSGKSDGSATDNLCEREISISIDRRRVMDNMRLHPFTNVNDNAEWHRSNCLADQSSSANNDDNFLQR